ncbi:MAG TPA: lactate racemase domain-containing protein, partial [Clostridia bacterium]|nr:lactate racemase domain-containing protein [Clostridia bacterium]
MQLSFEYGMGLVSAQLPDSTEVFIPGETVPDPLYIPADQIVEATRHSLRNPIGMPPLAELAFPGAKCAIVFPDRVKGGEHATSHRKVSIALVLEELYGAGVKQEDVLLICSNGLHAKNTDAEIRAILGDALYSQFAASGQIINHDSEDEAQLVDLGTTAQGDPVIMNRHVYEADVAVMIGHTQGNPYGGYSGGYKHCATGITHWRSIASHHVPAVMHRPEFVPVSGNNLMRSKFDQIGMHMEEKMGRKFFCVDAVLDSRSRQIEVFSGYAAQMAPLSWKSADRRTYVHWAEEKYDVLVFGMPQNFHYGAGMGTNPIMLMQALSAQVIRHKRVMKDNCVIICASQCNGWFNEALWPYTPELFELFGKDGHQILPDLHKYGAYYATHEAYIRRYRYAHAFHPFHGFSMMSCGHLAEQNTAAIYLTGAMQPGIARAMGLKTRATIEEAL